MDHEFAVPGKPAPRALSKRGSLPPSPSEADMRRIRLARQISTSHPKLLDIVGKHDGPVDSLRAREMRPRSNSLHLLADLKSNLKRNLSASNLAALSDSNLSITKALPSRSYDTPNSRGAAAKQYFDILVKRYFHQLTEGCGNEKCANKFCFSCKDRLKVPSDVLAVISIQLASNQRHFLCSPCNPKFTSSLPNKVFQPKNGKPKQFLQTLYSCSPFASFFTDSPAITKPEGLEITKPKPISTNRNEVQKRFGSSKIGGVNLNKISLSSKGDEQSKSTKNGTKFKSDQKTGAGVTFNRDSKPQLVKWTSGYDLTEPEYVNGDTKGSAHNLGQRSRYPHATVEDLLPLRTENPKLRSKSNHSRSLSSPVGKRRSKSSSGVTLSNEPPGNNLSPARLMSPSEALHETDSLREFERALSLELSFDSLGELSLTHLTLPMLQEAVNQYNECGEPSFLINTIRTVFTSPEALNASFKKDDSNPDSDVCLESVQDAYELLDSLEPSDLFTTNMTNALEILLTTLASSRVEPHQINQLLILLENPIIETQHELLKTFCHILSSLPDVTRSNLVNALSHYEVDHFQGLVQFFKLHLGTSLKPQQGMPDMLIDIAQILHIFYDASIEAVNSRNVTLATREDFYSEKLSRGMDYQSEYRKWSRRTRRKESEQGSSKEDGERSSMLQHPFLLDPASKVHVLHLDAVVQMREEYQRAILHQARVNQAMTYLSPNHTAAMKDSIKAAMCPFLVLEIRRDMLIPDTLQQIRLKHNDLKKPLKIKYVGGGEQGLDMGGLQKEFFQLIAESVFDPSYGMFTYSEESRNLLINGGSLESDDEFELVGTLLGLAIYNGVILNVQFPISIYKKLHGEPLDIMDLIDVMPSIGKGLQDMLEYEGDVEDTFCQTFQISYMSMGEMVTVDLIPNGAQTPVTNQNREEFVSLYKDHVLEKSVEKQFNAFARGFHMVCGGSALELFDAAETELLICGSPELDFHALERSATYEDGYSRRHHTIKAFWSIVHSLDNEEKKKLLHFITGSDRIPLKGLSSLPIVIQRNGPDSNRLPTAMTCFNRLLLSSYATPEKLRERVLVAIQYGKGFGLT
ncbi:probable E3 ubiquitin-protein ligase HECTD2 [Amphiura filiformis]|uniref:probable E3 ubiquitin-protein ligase HECTD2 n=1 Tax=Amphiura filiformis TaxID=82378 RepID=UPI003B218316